MQQRLAAGNGNPVKNALTLLQEAQDFIGIQRPFRKLVRQNQSGIVSPGASEVAAQRKQRTGHHARIIQKRELLHPCKHHISALLSFPVHIIMRYLVLVKRKNTRYRYFIRLVTNLITKYSVSVKSVSKCHFFSVFELNARFLPDHS